MIFTMMLSTFLAELVDLKDSLGSKMVFFRSYSFGISRRGKALKNLPLSNSMREEP